MRHPGRSHRRQILGRNGRLRPPSNRCRNRRRHHRRRPLATRIRGEATPLRAGPLRDGHAVARHGALARPSRGRSVRCGAPRPRTSAHLHTSSPSPSDEVRSTRLRDAEVPASICMSATGTNTYDIGKDDTSTPIMSPASPEPKYLTGLKSIEGVTLRRFTTSKASSSRGGHVRGSSQTTRASAAAGTAPIVPLGVR
jgi:hypothetical protein